jgi:hypothetical protein
LYDSDASLKSNALQIVAQKRYRHGFTIMGHYVLSNSMSWWGDAREGAPTQNPNNAFADYSRTSMDVRNRAVVSGIWDLPRLTSNPWGARVVNGWEVSGVVTMQGGMPYNLLSGLDNSLTAMNNDRPNVVGDWHLPDNRPKGDKVAQWFNTKAFAANSVGQFGNVGRYALRGPGLYSADLGFQAVGSGPGPVSGRVLQRAQPRELQQPGFQHVLVDVRADLVRRPGPRDSIWPEVDLLATHLGEKREAKSGATLVVLPGRRAACAGD